MTTEASKLEQGNGGRDVGEGPAPNGQQAPQGQNQAAARQDQSTFCVASIQVNKPDGRNEVVDYVYFKRTNYAIYRCQNHIIVCYSDDPKESTEQISKIAELIALRDQLQYLTMGSGDLASCYRESIAEALRLGLEGKIDVAKQALTAAIDDVRKTMARKSRVIYLSYAAPIAAVVAVAFFGLGLWFKEPFYRHLFIATGAGAVGGLLSISIAIRQRTIISDGRVSSNFVDATVRLMMAVISATALFLLLYSGVLHDVTVGGTKLSGNHIGGPVAFLIGFAAGFLERLVPDLLQKTAESGKSAEAEHKPPAAINSAAAG
jgi:hypothetical protein